MAIAIQLHSPAQRIVSLVPSITTLLHYLGLAEQTVGITKFCISPSHWHTSKPHIGGTKNINVSKIKALMPDCIICSKEENVAEQVQQLASISYILLTNVTNFASSLQMIAEVGAITGTLPQAKVLIKELKVRFTTAPLAPLKAVYLIWQKPYLTVGGDTFIHSMMRKAGFTNMYKATTRYPTLTLQGLQALAPPFVLLSSEPYPFKHSHAVSLRKLLPSSTILLVDGAMFSWYGSIMLAMPNYYLQLRQHITTL